MKKILVMAIALMSAVASFGQFGQLIPQKWTDEQGQEWQTFVFENAQIAACIKADNYLGKYYHVQIVIGNETGTSMFLDPSTMSASVLKKGKETPVKIYDHDSYVKAIKAKHNANNFGAALLGGSTSGHLDTKSIDKFYIDNKEVVNGESYLGMVKLDHKPGDTLVFKMLVLGTEYIFEFNVKGLK
jgi:hypothetical protein